MGLLKNVLLGAVVVFAFLWLVYMTVKLGTYAWFKGRCLFEQEQEKKNGKKSQVD